MGVRAGVGPSGWTLFVRTRTQLELFELEQLNLKGVASESSVVGHCITGMIHVVRTSSNKGGVTRSRRVVAQPEKGLRVIHREQT